MVSKTGKFRAFAYVSTKRAIARFAEMAKRKCARKRSYLDAGTYKNDETRVSHYVPILPPSNTYEETIMQIRQAAL